MNQSKTYSDKFYLCISFLLIFIFMSPYFFLGENVHLEIWDRLNGMIPALKVFAESGKMFSFNNVIPNILSGITRLSYPSELNLFYLLFYLGPFNAYVINKLLLITISFIGMLLLLKTHFLKDEDRKWIIYGSALCFAFVPLSDAGGLTITGFPLALYAFLNLRKNQLIKRSWTIIVLLPFYSDFIRAFIFFIFFMLCIFLYDLLAKKQFNKSFLSAIFTMTFMYCLIEYRLVYNTIFPEFISNRSDPSSPMKTGKSFLECFMKGMSLFIRGDAYHSPSFHFPFVLTPVLFVLLQRTFNKENNKRFYMSTLLLLVISSLLGCFLFFINKSPIWFSLKSFFASFFLLFFIINFKKINEKKDAFYYLLILLFSIIIFSTELNSSFFMAIWGKLKLPISLRFYYLVPFLWYITYAVALKDISHNLRKGSILVSFFLILQLIVCFGKTEQFQGFFNQDKNVVEKGLLRKSFDKFSFLIRPPLETIAYRKYYSEDLFKEVSDYIGQNKKDYKIINLGIQPAVLYYNGFYTLDGYVIYYPLDYKKKFRKIIEKELQKNEELRSTFDAMGNMCYLFSSEMKGDILEKLEIKNRDFSFKNLEINTEAIKDLGGSYLISAGDILNYKENNLKFEKKFENEYSPWKIYLYSIE